MLGSLSFALALTLLAPASPTFEEMRGFSTVVINHVNDVLGSENLPAAIGVPVEPGVLVTITPDRMQIFDHDVAALQGGRLADTTRAAECRSGCPAIFYDIFQQVWVEAAVEASTFGVQIPTRVLFAAHHDTPAETIVNAAYAASETRPVAPPAIGVLVNDGRAGLRSQPFFLLPPTGLEMRPGSAALGLTVRVRPGEYVVTAADSRYAKQDRVGDLKRLEQLARELKRRYPGKEVVILEPSGGVTLSELMRVVGALDATFPRVVLSLGQPVIVP